MAPVNIDSEKMPVVTEDGSTDWRGNPAVKASTGKLKPSILLLVNYALATLAFYGVEVNLVVFLRRVLHQESAEAANSVSKWTGTVYLFSLIGAFFSDSYCGRYMTCVVFQMIYLAGLVTLSLASRFMLVKPCGCGGVETPCDQPSALGAALFYLSIYMIAFGYGGYQPSVATFGADQFDGTDPGESRSKVVFFSYFYLALNVGSLFSNSVLVYYEDSGGWVIGFGASTAVMVLAFVIFFTGTPYYRHFKPRVNPLSRITQVFVSALRKWNVEVPPAGDCLYEVDDDESSMAGVRKILRSDKLRFLDKAATVTAEDYYKPSKMKDPWRLCTVTQVEQVKCVLKMMPIWLCTIVYSVVFAQMASLFVEQGDVMSTSIGSFRIPAASMSVCDILSVVAFVAIYQRVLAPVVSKFSKNPRGLTELQRMGVGLVIGMVAMVVAGTVEIERLKRVTSLEDRSSLSVLWQVPQYVLIGASEVFMYVGQLEFFNDQAPDGMKSFGSSLCLASIAIGEYTSTMLVTAVTTLTSGEKKQEWITANLNSGHLDRFYFLLAALSLVDLAAYVACAMWYKGIKLDNGEDSAKRPIAMHVYGERFN